MKKVFVLGSTGSVGSQAIDVLRKYKNHFSVFALAAYDGGEKILSQIKEFKPKVVCLQNKEAVEKLSKKFKKVKFLFGEDSLIKIVKNKEVDIAIFSSSGTSALLPLLESIKEKKKILIANKESIIVAGEIINKQLNKYKGELIPLDSEHSAIFECLKGEDKKEVKSLILTCSGGPFRNHSKEQLKSVKKEEVINHPVWKMGQKITVDSATLMNKGFEVIEAHYLFKMPVEKIKVVVHPEGIIHSMVEFNDGSVKALLSIPDMKVPIQSALFYPKRAPFSFNTISFSQIKTLSFFEPNRKIFPCLDIAYNTIKKKGTMPSALVFADEFVVNLFLEGKIKFLDIPKIIKKIMRSHKNISDPSLGEILGVEEKIKKEIKNIL